MQAGAEEAVARLRGLLAERKAPAMAVVRAAEVLIAAGYGRAGSAPPAAPVPPVLEGRALLGDEGLRDQIEDAADLALGALERRPDLRMEPIATVLLCDGREVEYEVWEALREELVAVMGRVLDPPAALPLPEPG